MNNKHGSNEGVDGEPIIYHGGTMTSKIPCREVLKTISKYAFTRSPFPVTLR